MNDSKFDSRLHISRVAADLWPIHRDGPTFAQVAQAAGMDVSAIKALFPSRKAMLSFRYASIPDRFLRDMASVPDYPDFTIAEKTSQFLFTAFDHLNETREFTEATFCQWDLTDFRKATAALFERMVEQDSRIPFVNRFFLRDLAYEAAAWQVVAAVRYWLRDGSDGTADTLALVDKATAFGQELLYSGILDKGLDLGRYAVARIRQEFK